MNQEPAYKEMKRKCLYCKKTQNLFLTDQEIDTDYPVECEKCLIVKPISEFKGE